VRYGDLGAAGELANMDPAGATSCSAIKRLTNEPRVASNWITSPTICDG
jgi:hypothetical protein